MTESQVALYVAIISLLGGSIIGPLVTFFISRRRVNSQIDLDKMATAKTEGEALKILGEVLAHQAEQIFQRGKEIDKLQKRIEDLEGDRRLLERARAIIHTLVIQIQGLGHEPAVFIPGNLKPRADQSTQYSSGKKDEELMKIKANLVSVEKFETDPAVGDYYFTTIDGGQKAIWLKYGPTINSWVDNICHLPVTPGKYMSWDWDGNEEQPTLTPSIKTTHHTGEVFHGYLTAGELIYLNDSTIKPN